MIESERSFSRRKRIRLAADVRAQKILDSALIEFSRHGFAAARIEDIASGASLSKSGVYAHFQGKDKIFEALLTRALVPVEIVPFHEDDSVVDFVDRFLDWCYTRIREPEYQAMLRLLLAETNRVPELIRRWRKEYVEPVLRAQVGQLHAAIDRGQLLSSPVTQDFSMAYAPVLYWSMLNMMPMYEGEPARDEVRQRDIHRQMLLALLPQE